MEGIRDGFTIFKNNLGFIIKHPFTLLPLLLALGASGWGAYYARTLVDVDALTVAELLGMAYLISAISTFSISIAALFIVELLEQHETTGVMNPFTALGDLLTKDLWRALPIIILWSIIDFLISLLINMLAAARRDRKNSRRRHRKSWLEHALEAFQIMFRMKMMLAFTIIGWDSKGPIASYDRASHIYKTNFSTGLTGVGLSKFVSFISMVPAILVLVIGQNIGAPQGTLYTIVLVYLIIAWSIGRLIEQLYVSELYLWHLHYETAKQRSTSNKTLTLIDVKRPSFSDNKQDLTEAATY